MITQDDIRRSGMTRIAELLRMVPGLGVAHIDAGKWAISAREFNSRFSDKLLVLIDGRSLYSSARSGVFWELQNLMLQDIERIDRHACRGGNFASGERGAYRGKAGRVARIQFIGRVSGQSGVSF